MSSAPLIVYETVSIEPVDAAHNRAWRVDHDGRVFVRSNGAGALRPSDHPGPYWFRTPWPEAPVQTVSATTLDRLRSHLATVEAGTHRTHGMTEGGALHRVRVLRDDHTLTVEADDLHRQQVLDIIHPILTLLREDA